MTISIRTTPGMTYAITATGPCAVAVIEDNLPIPFLNIDQPGQYIAVAPSMQLHLTDDHALVTPVAGKASLGAPSHRDIPSPPAAPAGWSLQSGLPQDNILQHGFIYNLNWVPPEQEKIDLSPLLMDFDRKTVTSCQLWFALHPTRGKPLFIHPGSFTWLPAEREFSRPGFYRFSLVREPQFSLVRMEYIIAI